MCPTWLRLRCSLLPLKHLLPPRSQFLTLTLTLSLRLNKRRRSRQSSQRLSQPNPWRTQLRLRLQ